MNQDLRIEERRRACESIMYRMKVVEVLKMRTEICPKKESVRHQTSGKKCCCLQWIQVSLQHCKVALVRECCDHLQIEYFGAKSCLTYMDHSLDLYQYF